MLERRRPLLEGGLEAICVATGQAAVNYAVLNLAGMGGNIVSPPQLYGPDAHAVRIFSARSRRRVLVQLLPGIDRPGAIELAHSSTSGTRAPSTARA